MRLNRFTLALLAIGIIFLIMDKMNFLGDLGVPYFEEPKKIIPVKEEKPDILSQHMHKTMSHLNDVNFFQYQC